MPFETQPFNLGNTLARASQIQSFRSRNELNKLRSEEFKRIRDQESQVQNAFASEDPINSLLALGQPGMQAANQAIDLKSALAKLEGEELENAVTRGRLLNNTARSIIASKNPAQAASLALKNPEIARLFPNVDVTGMDPEELIAAVEKLELETRIFNDPQELSRIISGQEAIDLGGAPGTVFEEKSKGGQVTDFGVLQQPQKAGQTFTVGPDGTVTFTQGGPAVNEKKINTDAIESANASGALRRNLTSTLPEVEANKESVGFRGQFALGAGGVATNILGQGAGDTVAQAIAGNDQEKISQVLTQLQTLRSALIPILTGEKSSRFSEPEREIANKAVGIIDQIKGPADLSRSFPQVIGALKTLTVAALENEFEQASITPVVNFPFDLNTEDGLRALWRELYAAGFSVEEGVRARDRLLKIQNQ